jgi:tripartite-type tricarboxylate transporter receptor subunit TctC
VDGLDARLEVEQLARKVRAGTPPAIIQKIQRDMAEALRMEDVRGKLADLGLEPVGNTPEQFAALIEAESRKWGDIVRKANITAQ